MPPSPSSRTSTTHLQPSHLEGLVDDSVRILHSALDSQEHLVTLGRILRAQLFAGEEEQELCLLELVFLKIASSKFNMGTAS